MLMEADSIILSAHCLSTEPVYRFAIGYLGHDRGQRSWSAKSIKFLEFYTMYAFNKTGDQTQRRLSAIMFYLHFLPFLGVIYRWNRNQVFYFLSSSDVAYLDYVGFYKALNFATSLKIES